MDFDIGTVLFYGGIGLIIGSFLNVLVVRSGTGTDVGGRSQCDVCGKQLKWYHLIPVFSWIVLRGHCAYCGARISVQHPLVELTTGVVFAMIGFLGLPFLLQLLAYAIGSLLIIISVYDLRHTIILNAWAYSFAVLALLYAYIQMPPQSGTEWAVLLLSGPLVAFPLWALWFISHGTWMGFGDVKLALGIGWFLGPIYGLLALFLAFILGAIVSVSFLILVPKLLEALRLHKSPLGSTQAGFTMKSEVPFGPFLTCSCFIVWCMHTAGLLMPFFIF